MLSTTSTRVLPAARTIGLVTTESIDDVLVYDQQRHHIHHLNHGAAAIWRLCNGERTVGELASLTTVDEDIVQLALQELDNAHLLDGPLVARIRDKQTRRTFMKRAVVAGAIPAIISISAPIAASASSICGSSCQTDDDCTNDRCPVCVQREIDIFTC